MRTIILSAIVILFAIGCKKTNTPVVPPSGGSGPISITSISPAKPYADDEITITGTGFNPDKTKDTVDFGGGDAAAGTFSPYFYGEGTTSKAVIISATGTQLVIKAVNPDSAEVVTPTGTSKRGLNKMLFNNVQATNNSLNQIRVRVGAVQTSKLTPFKQLPLAHITINGSPTNIYTLAPNDSFEVTLNGVNSDNPCSSGVKLYLSCGNPGVGGCGFVNNYLTFNGNTPQCNCDNFGTLVLGCQGNTLAGKVITHTPLYDIVHCIVPANFFNTSYSAQSAANNTARILIKMKMINEDGKEFILAPVYCYAYPTHP
ncbi:MAG: IPT/TIG domain-containing protein [Ferruginibacter sp.]